MFLARLDEAKDSAARDVHRRGLRNLSSNEECKENADENSSGVRCHCLSERATLLERCTEYLFDLFDANLTPEYQRINRIQEKAIASFSNSLGDNDSWCVGKKNMMEYTFEQGSLHNEFKDVFEELISDFLHDEKISVDDFYSTMKKVMPSMQNESKFANEILDCVTYYLDFECWANSIRAEAKYRKQLTRAITEIDENGYGVCVTSRYPNTERVTVNSGYDSDHYGAEERKMSYML